MLSAPTQAPLQMALCDVPCPVLVTDANGRLLNVNTAAELALKEARAELHGLLVDRVFSPASRIFLQTHVWPMLLRDGAVREIYLQMLTKAGETIPVMLNVQSQGQGPERQDVWVCFEARDRARFEVELLRARQKAEAVAAELQQAHQQLSELNAELARKAQIVEQQNIELAQKALIVEQQNAELALLSHTDPLTGLGNRRALHKALQDWQASAAAGSFASLLMVDVDHFKMVNDSLGHAAGDQVLIAVADALRKAVRHPDGVTRYGGEEFALWLPGIAQDHALGIAARIHNEMTPIRAGGRSITVSIGVASVRAPASAMELQALAEHADEAVYAAKHAGRNCTKVFDDRKLTQG